MRKVKNPNGVCGSCGKKLKKTKDSSGVYQKGYTCDLCGTSFKDRITRWNCSSCFYDVCLDCICFELPTKKTLPKQKCGSCGNQCKATTTREGSYKKGYTCDNCKKMFKYQMTRWCCFSCNWDKCIKCYLTKLVSKYRVKPPKCGKCRGRMAFADHTSGPYKKGFVCDICLVASKKDAERFNCGVCNYDLCKKCGLIGLEASKKRLALPTSPISPKLPEYKGDSEELKRKLEEMEDSTNCCVCMDTKKNVVFLPCNHLCCCKMCAKSLNKCPMCRMAITKKMTVYL